jgi:hypothetical protein
MWQKTIVLSVSLVVLGLSAGAALSQVGGGGSGSPMGPRRMGGYGYGPDDGRGLGGGYGMGPGMMGGWVNVPTELPAPKNAQWLGRLRDILGLERESLAQYQSDQRRFNAQMPYGMVIPQEENHIRWIEELLKAYGLPVEGKASPAVVRNRTLTEAFKEAAKLEAELLPCYEWLVSKAEDRDTAGVLNTILLQSRWHLALFQHALGAGAGRGYGWGGRMMGGDGDGY